MNLSQRKLNKAEWNSIEISVSNDEKNIIKLITEGFNNINNYCNDNLSLMDFLKIEYSESNESYIYEFYLKEIIQKLIKKYDINYHITLDKKNKITKANMVRIESNSNEYIKQKKDNIYEYVLIELVSKMFKYYKTENHRWCYYYYTLLYLLKYYIKNLNKIVIDFIKWSISYVKQYVDKSTIIAKAYDYIEKNEYILKYAPNKLYSHQKEIYCIFKNKQPDESCLILYTAPTSTGKTLTPLGLSEKYKIIFVCAARHVGVSLAKSAISVGKKVAFAFGCETADDIRLHYFAAKEYERNFKSGGIFKVDNSIGDNVEIIICDIKSYLVSMYYMTSFFPKENIILFWDEPTITLDYNHHECHHFINEIWKNNIISNIILSSATLPQDHEITGLISDFMNKFHNPTYHRITSNECKKSISLINNSGYVTLPHLLYENFNDLKKSANFCKTNKVIYRYFDLFEVSKFIIIFNESFQLESYNIENYFEDISDITMESIKEYYICLLNIITHEQFDIIYSKIQNLKKLKIQQNYKNQGNGINITTSDAYSLTDGPTIFIADDIHKIAKFCIQSASIPNSVIKIITDKINFNNKINDEIKITEKNLEDKMKKIGLDENDDSKTKKLSKDIKDPDVKLLSQKIKDLNSLYKEITIDDIYVPNKLQHIEKWFGEINNNAFTSNIDNNDVERVMSLNNIDDIWKILLLLGIGLFSKDIDISYTEIVKEFADNQKLYLIIANGDYIYGTNYQFCHSFIGKDLQNMTQEKIIQSMGRVGRNKLQHTYSIRFRNNDIIEKIFIKEENKIEAQNMNLLFSSI
jgi:hypothetical protein